MIPLRRRLALLLAPELRSVAVLIDEALAALDEPVARPFNSDIVRPAIIQARRKLAEARALLRGT
jgi:hypothetical protein